MHELGIVFHIIDRVEELAKENNVKAVSKINIEIGEVSLVIPSYFEDVWKWAIKKSTYMKDCELNMIIIEAISYCKDCEQTYSTTKYAKKCPHCNSENTYLVTGSEVNIKDIEVIESD